MAADMVFSSEAGEYLNKEIQNKIAGHLFLVCNYNAESVKAFSEDARFFQASLNMYKFLVDAGICNKLKDIGKSNKISWKERRFKEISDIIVAIRTTLGHNQDKNNGTDEDREKVVKWLRNVTGKDEMTCASDYEAATKKLMEYGTECVSILEEFIRNAAASENVQNIIEDWENAIINFYKRGTSKNIFEGQLMMAYYAKVGGSKPSKYMVAEWVQRKINEKELSQIHSMNALLKRRGLRNSTLVCIQQNIDQCDAEIRKREHEIIKELGLDKDELNKFDYLNYYIKSMPKKIRDELVLGNVTSLLPQDIIQQIIESEFQNISIYSD
jgi:hypothetical protein